MLDSTTDIDPAASLQTCTPLPKETDHAPSLPEPLSALVGREREVADLAALLHRQNVRLVTMTGPGGVGKTRLALHIAREASEIFTDGVWLVPLAPVADPALVLSKVAQVFGVREARQAPLIQRVIARLRDQRLLLLLDNFEHVAEAAPLLTDLLSACSGLKVLVTSRMRLRLTGEREYPVRPLALPGPWVEPSVADLIGFGAAHLFVERAQAVQPDFSLTDKNAAIVADLCRRLDGLPLAIELAAARTKVFPPQTLLTRLEPRLPLLTGGGRDLPARQQTMRNAIAWSYDLLTPSVQVLFRRLGCFVGGCTLDAAEEVCGGDPCIDVVEGVASLVEQSLLRAHDLPGSEPRYSMLETVREFALERLAASGEEADVRHRHASWCLNLAERLRDEDDGTCAEPVVLSRVELDHDNMRAALAWLEQEGSPEANLRLASDLHALWFVRSHHAEGVRWLENAVMRGQGAPPEVRLRALSALGRLLWRQGHYEAAQVQIEEQRRLALAIDDQWEATMALLVLGAVSLNQGKFDEATPRIEEGLDAWRRLGNDAGINSAHYCLGIIAYGKGSFTAAVTHVEEALTWRRERGDAMSIAIALDALALLYCELGDEARAAPLLAEALPLWQRVGNKEGLAEWLAAVARLAGCRRRLELAARFYGAAEALTDTLGCPLVVPPPVQYRRAVDSLRVALGEDAFATAWAAGRTWHLDQAFEEALTFTREPADDASVPVADHGLTRRELEVLRLLTDGRSDREIGETLFVSRHTAANHVKSILSKLGVNSRAAAAAHAVRHGLS